jgi:hypothetical protein
MMCLNGHAIRLKVLVTDGLNPDVQAIRFQVLLMDGHASYGLLSIRLQILLADGIT